MRRHHVHLSADIETARTVGARHGHLFLRSDNGVWLTDAVPPEFLHEGTT